jgi:hypothetical protein
MNLHGQDASVFLELGKLLDPWLIDAHPSSEGKTVHARLESVGEAPHLPELSEAFWLRGGSQGDLDRKPLQDGDVKRRPKIVRTVNFPLTCGLNEPGKEHTPRFPTPIFLLSRFLSSSIARKSHKRFGLRDFRASSAIGEAQRAGCLRVDSSPPRWAYRCAASPFDRRRNHPGV